MLQRVETNSAIKPSVRYTRVNGESPMCGPISVQSWAYFTRWTARGVQMSFNFTLLPRAPSFSCLSLDSSHRGSTDCRIDNDYKLVAGLRSECFCWALCLTGFQPFSYHTRLWSSLKYRLVINVNNFIICACLSSLLLWGRHSDQRWQNTAHALFRFQ